MNAVATGRRHHVVIVGGGFGRLQAAKALRRAAVEVTVIDRTNHHLVQPLLHQLATGMARVRCALWAMSVMGAAMARRSAGSEIGDALAGNIIRTLLAGPSASQSETQA